MKKIRFRRTICFLMAGMALCLHGCTAEKTAAGAPDAAESGPALDMSTDSVAEFDSAALRLEKIDAGYTERELSGSYDSSVTELELMGEDVRITQAGTYILTGVIADGQILVEAGSADKVQLVLNGVSVTNSDGPAIEIRSADKVFLTLAEGSENSLCDGESYTLAAGEDEPNTCIYSKADLCINGSGRLTITGNYNHGVYSKDDLVVTNGTITVSAVNDGLKGKDCVEICGGSFVIEAGGDGIQSNQTEDAARGYISIDGGDFSITSGCDGLQAETRLQVTAGTLELTTGGGSANASVRQGNDRGFWGFSSASTEDTESAKGLKAGVSLYIEGGTLTIDSSDDALHANGDILIAGGKIDILSGDDGAHADSALAVTGGEVNVLQSYEGLEGAGITLSGGRIVLVSSDDGLNAAGGNDGSALDGRPGQGMFAADASVYIRITGGEVEISAAGDGIDSNGSLYIEGGTVTVYGPTDSGNGALDYAGSASISGGIVIALGSGGMAQGFGSSSSQCSFLYTFPSTVAAGTQITIRDQDGALLAEVTAEKAAQTMVFSSAELTQGETYTVTAGSVSGEITQDSASAGSAGMGGFVGFGGGMDGGRGDRPGKPSEGDTKMPPDGKMAPPSDNTPPETNGKMS